MQPYDHTASCCFAGITAAAAAALGLPQGDLIAAMAGAFFGLAYTKPVHWGGWFTIPDVASKPLKALYWFRRILIVAFILCATAVVCTAFAQIVHANAVDDRPSWWADWAAGVNTKLLSMLLSAFGQWMIPRIKGWIDTKVSKEAGS